MASSGLLISTGEPAYAVNRDGMIVAWNAAAERTFGYAEASALGRRCWELLAGQDLFGNRYCCQGCPLREMAFGHQSVKGHELFLMTASNGLQRFSLCTLLVRDGAGHELFVHMCCPDRCGGEGDLTAPAGGRPSANHQRGALSKREIEVLALLAEGKDTTEVALDLCISPATVRNHTQHILYKLRAHSRVAAINTAHKLGLI